MDGKEPKSGLSASIAVPVDRQRTWQRKWRDIVYYRDQLADAYVTHHLYVDDLVRRVESFFKTCHEFVDWLTEEKGLPAEDFARKSWPLQLCDAAAQTAKHYKRKPSKYDPITAFVVKVSTHDNGVRADFEWASAAGRNGKTDALELANECITEWEQFFAQHKLDPAS